MSEELPPSGRLINAWLSLFVTPFLDVAKKNMEAALVARKRKLAREYDRELDDEAIAVNRATRKHRRVP